MKRGLQLVQSTGGDISSLPGVYACAAAPKIIVEARPAQVYVDLAPPSPEQLEALRRILTGKRRKPGRDADNTRSNN